MISVTGAASRYNPARMALAPGTRLGVYEISAPVGTGGMGEVYKARDTRLGRTVAIKILSSALAGDRAFRARFESEARTLSQLAHPNICVIHDVGESDDVSYLVLEYLDGETLADRIARTPIPFDEARRIGVDICRALDAAHRAGIIHRDLKPGNVILTRTGAKLLDFGLARGHDRGDFGATTAVALTQQGTVVGTPAYMSPEQLHGAQADTRSDIFALGAVLYELFTGRRAFEGSTAMAIAASIVGSDPPPPSTVNPRLPSAVDPIVQGCLARDPDGRWQSAHDVGRQLEAVATGRRHDASTSAPRSTWMPWAVAALALAIAAAAWLLRGSAAPPERPTFAFQVSLTAGSLLQSVEGNTVALSPDGSQLAWIALETDATRIWIRSLAQLDNRPLRGTENATALFWSPDGKSIAFFAGGLLQRLDLSTDTPITVTPVRRGNGYTGAWGAGGRILYAPIQGEGIYRVSTTGGAPEKIVSANRPAGERRVGWPCFVGDGPAFTYILHREDGASFLMLAREGQPPRRIAELDVEAQYMDPGYLVYVRNGALVAQRFDVAEARLTGELLPIAPIVQSFPASGWARFAVARSGTVAFGSGQDRSHLAVFDRTGAEQSRLGGTGDYDDVELAPGRQSVLFSRTNAAGIYDVWSLDLTSGTETLVTSGPGTKIGPVFTPDGAKMIYSRTAGGSPELYERDLASGAEERLLPNESFQQVTSLSRDGKIIVFQQRTDRGDWDIWMLPRDGSGRAAPVVASPFNEVSARLSPDDRLIAFASDETSQSEVYVAPFPSGTPKTRVSRAGGRAPHWTPDGRDLLYIAGDGHVMRVPMSAAGQPGSPVLLFDAHVAWRDFLVLPDGRLLAIVPDKTGRFEPLTVIVNPLPHAR
jgi:serine/threonine protein kinase/dipeptidyl aminopeptidase/acylaminoacyl peptidase